MSTSFNPIINSGGSPDTAPGGASKINAMLQCILGNKAVVTPASSTSGSPTIDYDPSGAHTVQALSRVDLNPPGVLFLAGLDSTSVADEKKVRLRNISAFVVTLAHLSGANVSSANRFYCPGLDNYLLQPGQTIALEYWAGTDNVWVVGV